MDLPHVVDDKTLTLDGVEKKSFNFFEDQVVPSKCLTRKSQSAADEIQMLASIT